MKQIILLIIINILLGCTQSEKYNKNSMTEITDVKINWQKDDTTNGSLIDKHNNRPIIVSIDKQDTVIVNIFNVNGLKITKEKVTFLKNGRYKLVSDYLPLKSGVYFIHIRTSVNSFTRNVFVVHQ